jgi:hypothetical protein
MKVSGQLHALAALPPGKESTLRIVEEACWASEQVYTQYWAKAQFPAPDTGLIIISV